MRLWTKISLWVVAVLLVIIGALVLVGFLVAGKALAAKDALEGAQSTVSTLQKQAAAFDMPGVQASAQTLQSQTAAATEATADPLYRWAEGVPWAGPNLAALRQISQATDTVSAGAIVPLADLAGSLSLSSLAPVDKRINMAPLTEGRDALAKAQAAISSAHDQILAVDTSSTLSQVADAKAALLAVLPKGTETITKLDSLLNSAWAILGGNGPRNYLLVSPNNAEVTALGGGTASMSLLTVDKGSVAITDQANSRDFPFDNTAVLNLDGNVEAIFPFITQTMNWATSRPDFPTAAKLIEAWWAKYRGTPVDGVLSVDPIALSYLLEATGPVSAPDGGQLNSQNAVATLLNEAYLKSPPSQINAKTDAYFAATTKAVFDKLLDFKGDPQALLNAFDKGVKNGSIMAYLNDPVGQQLIAQTDLAGVLPADNREATITGVYFRDVTSSKTDFYLKTSVDQSTNVCQNPSAASFTTSVTLHSTLTRQLASELPNYVRGPHNGRYFSTEVYVYGPVGSRVTKNSIEQMGFGGEVRSVGNDMGRPVARFLIDLAPGETATVSADFIGGTSPLGKPEVRTSPMINPTVVHLDAANCK